MKTAILLIDHGSRLEESNDLMREVAAMVCRQAPSGMIVRYAHMELASPSLSEGFDACVADGADEVVVLPYMLGPGRHSTLDIPRLVQEAASRHPGVRAAVSEPLGLHPKIGEVVLERVTAARAAVGRGAPR